MNYNNLKLPPILGEIKFSESIKKKLYSKDNINFNMSKMQISVKKEENYTNNNNNNNNNNFNSSYEQSDDLFENINEINDDSVFTEEDQDLDDDDDDDQREEEIIDDQYDYYNNDEILDLKEQLNFLKKENYYMQLEIEKLETKLRKEKSFNLNTIELDRHLTNLESFFISKQQQQQDKIIRYSTLSTSYQPIKSTSVFNNYYNYNKDNLISDIYNNNHLKLPSLSFYSNISSSNYSPRNNKIINYTKDKQLIDDTINQFYPFS
jgi:hypothetical protein